MHKMKLLIAGCVFSFMFGGAWLINENVKREYVESIAFTDSTIQLTNSETPIGFFNKEENVFEKFRPREYVRVVTR